MPIPASTIVASNIPSSWDTLLLQLCLLTAKRLQIQAYRAGAVGGVYSRQRDQDGGIVPTESRTYDLPNDNADVTALVTGLQSLAASYNTAKGRAAGKLASLQIKGTITDAGAIAASVRLATNGAPVVDIPDAYALAATDTDFNAFVTQALGLFAAFNAAEKVV